MTTKRLCETFFRHAFPRSSPNWEKKSKLSTCSFDNGNHHSYGWSHSIGNHSRISTIYLLNLLMVIELNDEVNEGWKSSFEVATTFAYLLRGRKEGKVISLVHSHLLQYQQILFDQKSCGDYNGINFIKIDGHQRVLEKER